MPPRVLNGTRAVAAAFLQGFLRSEQHGLGKEGVTGLFFLAQRLGHAVTLAEGGGAGGGFRLVFGGKAEGEAPGEHVVAPVAPVGDGAGGYVYDLTTGNHHFHVGPGRLVVHNTDSVIFETDTTDLHRGHALGTEVEAWLNGEVLPRHGEYLSIECEEICSPYLQIMKKGTEPGL